MKFTTSQTSFKSGRLSPKLFNRVDTKQYRDGCSEMSGFRILPEGGAERIKGTRLVRRQGSIPQGKIISFSLKGKSLTVIFEADGDALLAHILVYPYWSEHVTHDIIPAGGSYLIGTTGASGIHASFSGLSVYELDYAVTGNSLVLTHYSGKMPPYALTFSDAGLLTAIEPWPTFTGELSGYSRHSIYPMSDIGKHTVPLTISWDSTESLTSITSTDPDIVNILQNSPVLYMEGLGFKDFGDGTAQALVGADFFYPKTLIADGVLAMPSYVRDAKDGLTAIGVSTVEMWATALWKHENWPRTVTAHEGRIVFGGTKEDPLTIFGSKVGNFKYMCHLRRADSQNPLAPVPEPFGNTVTTDPYVFAVAGKDDSQITFVEAAQRLIIGTDRREYVAGGGDTILSPLSVSCQPYSGNGSVALKASSSGSSVYYVSANGKKLFKFKHNPENGSFVSQELSLLFSDLIESDTIDSVLWAPHISSLLIAMSSGNLYGITDDEQGDTLAFYKTGRSGIDDMTFVTGRDTEYGDHVLLNCGGFTWEAGLIAFESQENGLTQSGVFEGRAEYNLFKYLDRGHVYFRTGDLDWEVTGYAPVTTIARGVPIDTRIYPAGTEIYILSTYDSDFIYEQVTVPEATDEYPYSIIPYGSLPDEVGASQFYVGQVPPSATLATMPVEAGQQWGTAQMGIKNIDTLGIRHYLSYSYEVSSDGVNWEEVVVADNEGKATTGRTQKKFTSSPDYDQIVYIRNTKPEPLTITGINMRGVSNDG